jgi:hypothetical protein
MTHIVPRLFQGPVKSAARNSGRIEPNWNQIVLAPSISSRSLKTTWVQVFGVGQVGLLGRIGTGRIAGFNLAERTPQRAFGSFKLAIRGLQPPIPYGLPHTRLSTVGPPGAYSAPTQPCQPIASIASKMTG